MDFPQPLVYFLPYEREKNVTNVFTRNISELAPVKLVMSLQKKLLKYCWRHCGTYYGNRK